MNSLADFVVLVRDELGLEVTEESAGDGWDRLSGWDSVQLLALLSMLERETQRPISLPHMLEAESLLDVYHLAGGR